MAPIPGLATALLPLALFILIGWAIGRAKKVDLSPIATLLVYAISPVVAFGSTAQMAFDSSYVFLPLVTYILAAACGMGTFALGKGFVLQKHDSVYLLPNATGTGNNGYFGLPLAMAVFAPEYIGVYFLAMLGPTIFESTFGYYFIARGRLPMRAALARVARLPMLYAIALGMIFSKAGIALDPGIVKLWESSRGAYVSLGMMLIGLALARHGKLVWEKNFTALCMAGKYGFWALGAIALIWLDTHTFKIYNAEVHKMLLILSVTPVAANTVAYAAEHDFKPELAASVVFITTVASCLFLPFALNIILAWA